MNYISDLFEQEPEQWGMRGDPYLWLDLKEHLKGKPLPKMKKAFNMELLTAIKSLIGENLYSGGDKTYVERYAHGGLSSGYISHDFWIEEALPLLMGRYIDAMNSKIKD